MVEMKDMKSELGKIHKIATPTALFHAGFSTVHPNRNEADAESLH